MEVPNIARHHDSTLIKPENASHTACTARARSATSVTLASMLDTCTVATSFVFGPSIAFSACKAAQRMGLFDAKLSAQHRRSVEWHRGLERMYRYSARSSAFYACRMMTHAGCALI